METVLSFWKVGDFTILEDRNKLVRVYHRVSLWPVDLLFYSSVLFQVQCSPASLWSWASIVFGCDEDSV